ncbi:MAG: glycosyltransferase family 4 protein [Planctomycetota bacterium]
MSPPLRVLTVGVKPAVNAALAGCDDLRVFALSEHVKRPRIEGPLATLPYRCGAKLSPESIAQVRAAILRLRPDVVQCQAPKTLAHTTLAATGVWRRPAIVSYRGIASRPSRWRAEDRLTYLSPLVDAHACESRACLDALVAGGVRPERCAVVYNCLTRPPGQPVAREALRREFGIPTDAFVVATVANFRPVKGGDLLLRAAIECRDLADCHWLLVGHVNDREMLRLAADRRVKGRVHLAGFREDASEVAGAASVFCMPSRAEALGVALLEAMSLGVCPAVSDAGGMKEAVRHGVQGLVFERGSVAALVQAIRRLHANRDELAAFGRAAKRRFHHHFSADGMVGRLAAVYRDVATVAPRLRLAA